MCLLSFGPWDCSLGKEGRYFNSKLAGEETKVTFGTNTGLDLEAGSPNSQDDVLVILIPVTLPRLWSSQQGLLSPPHPTRLLQLSPEGESQGKLTLYPHYTAVARLYTWALALIS